jgi:hypothetical protein
MILLASCLQNCMTYTIVVCMCTVNEIHDDGQTNCPKRVEFHSKNKFEKLVILIGFIIGVLEPFTGNLRISNISQIGQHISVKKIPYEEHNHIKHLGWSK